MNLYNPGGPRRSGRTTAMVLDIISRLKATDKKVFVVVHNPAFTSYVKQLLNERLSSKQWKHRVRFIDMSDTSVDDQAVIATKFSADTHMRIVRGIDNTDVFVDHAVRETR